MGAKDDPNANHEEWYNRNWGTNWEVPTPRGRLPRRVAKLVRDNRLAEAIIVSQSVLGYSPAGQAIVPGQRGLTSSGSQALSTAGDGAGLHYQRVRRNGGATKERWVRYWGPMPFHHIVDPTGASAGWGFIISDLVVPTFDSGNAWVFFGVGNFNTTADETDKTGAWWHTSNSLLKWVSGVYEGTGTPSTTLHETTHDDLTFDATGVTQAHRLSIWFDPTTKSIKFYANGVLKDTFTPSVSLNEFGAAPYLMYAGITESGADASFYTFGGGNPRLLVLSPAA